MAQIEFGDKTRTLKFDLRAIKDLESAMGGASVADIIQKLMGVSVTAITTTLWAGLKHEDPSLNVALVTKMLQKYMDEGKRLKVLGKALNKALIEETGLLRTDDEDAEGNEETTEAATA